MTSEGLTQLRCAKQALEQRLSRVIARTERLATANQRGGMLLDSPPTDGSLHSVDVRAFLGAQRIADAIEQGDLVEYWKSSPYLFNFMDSYALKGAFKKAAGTSEIVKFVREHPDTFLDFEKARTYQPLEPANPRLRGLLSETVDRGMWRLLWIPPSLNYYTLAGPFATPGLSNVTKRLVFSAWHMVPRAVASLISYEAERKMMREPHPRARLTQEDWRKQRGLLRFGISADRLTGMPLLLLVYPCLTFARFCDPRELARDRSLTAAEVRLELAARLNEMVKGLAITHETGGNADERWYWLAPMLLDFAEFPAAAQAWWERTELAQIWAGAAAGEEDAGWSRHVYEAWQTLNAVRAGKQRLGPPPADLFDVLSLAASAAPATAALRSYTRTGLSESSQDLSVRDAAARSGRAFLSLFNHAEVIEAIRAELGAETYWQRVLEYVHNGGLQAVLDEYTHLLRESLGCAVAPVNEMAEKLAAELIGALTLRTASLRVNEISAPPYAREAKIKSEPMHIRFAMRFGDERHDDEAEPGGQYASVGTRKERVRAAFNSPFWPFVLVSTSSRAGRTRFSPLLPCDHPLEPAIESGGSGATGRPGPSLQRARRPKKHCGGIFNGGIGTVRVGRLGGSVCNRPSQTAATRK